MSKIGDLTVTVDGEEISVSDYLTRQGVEFNESEDSSDEPDEREVGPHGFPENTPVKDMTDSERAAYYKYQNRKTEKRLQDLQTASSSKSDDDAVEAARLAGLNAGLTVAAKAEVARRLGAEPNDLEAVLSLMSEGALVKDGAVNEDAVASLVDTFSKVTKPGDNGSEGGGENVNEKPEVSGPNFTGLTGQGVPKGNKAESVNSYQAAEKARMEKINEK